MVLVQRVHSSPRVFKDNKKPRRGKMIMQVISAMISQFKIIVQKM